MDLNVIIYTIFIVIIVYLFLNKQKDTKTSTPSPITLTPVSDNTLPTPIVHDTSRCDEGIVYQLDSSETYDDITHTYRKSLTMTPVTELRELGDPNYCHDTSVTDVCSRYTKTCNSDEIRTANVVVTSGSPLAFACRNNRL